MRRRHPSTRGLRPSSLVSVATWTAARRGGCALATPPDSRRPSVASRLCRRLDSGVASSGEPDSGAARQQCAGAAIDSRAPPVASRLIAVWATAQRGGRAFAPPLNSRRPSVASRPCRRQCSGAARQQCAGKRRGEAAVRWRCFRLEAFCRLSSYRRLDAARRGGCALAPPPDSRRPSVASRLIAARTAARRAAVRWTAARRGSIALAPLLDSRPPSVASRLCHRLDSSAARHMWRRGRQQCVGAAPRLETLEAPVRRLSSPSPPGQRRGEQLCAGQRPGEAAMRWTAAREAAVRWRRYRLEASVRRLSSHRRLDSGAARRLCARQRRGEAAMRWTARGKAAVRWRRLLTRGLRPSHLLARSPPVQWRGEQPCAGRRRG